MKKDFYINNYELRPFKKSISKPKYYLPPFLSSVLLNNISNEQICLLCKNNLNIMLLENFENNEEIKKYGEEKIESENEEEYENKEIKKIKIKKQKSKFYKNDEHKCKSKCIII